MSLSQRAACANMDRKIFFPDIFDADGDEKYDDGTIWENFGDTSAFYDQARSVCQSCPVREECLDEALERKERWGMWGGLTPIERRRIERKARRDRLKVRRAEALEETS